ncbi:amidohydrolase family protein [Methylobacterium organophilum]|uniref:Atrazine chlorohydrolase n=1 Tax=Methylobacterium organophilum TaxID=410 RepID=A0ABQ4T558_METOR|nr:amidohydrolase [Methylobacterium organophilum]GJE25375.1 Atrazine chlorohydrolase [Methylobacterium organophilum]
MSLILADACLVTMNPNWEILERASLLVEADRIAGIGSRASLSARAPEAEILDCAGMIVIPGMVNTHTHLFQTLLKGPGDDMVLKKWFACMTGPAACNLTEADVSAAATHGCVESIRSGVTTLVDFMYAHPRPGLTRAVVEAYEATGMRGFVCRGFLTDGLQYGVPEPLIETVQAALADARAQILAQNRPGGRVQVGLAPCMIWSLDEASLHATRALADELGVLVTIHVAETPFEIEVAAERYGRTDTAYLSDIGFLKPDVLAVHCVQCGSADIALLARHGAKVSHNPCSNMYLASGLAPIPAMRKAGIPVGLASDGPASSNNHSLFQAMKFAALTQKGFHRDPEIMTARDALEMATIGGARAVGLEAEIGSIELGKKADLAVVDLRDAFASPIHDPVSSLVYAALGHETRHVLIDGRLVMRDRQLLSADEGAVRARAQAAAADLTRRAGIASRARIWCDAPA